MNCCFPRIKESKSVNAEDDILGRSILKVMKDVKEISLKAENDATDALQRSILSLAEIHKDRYRLNIIENDIKYVMRKKDNCDDFLFGFSLCSFLFQFLLLIIKRYYN